MLVPKILQSYTQSNPPLALPGTQGRCVSSPASSIPDQSFKGVHVADLQFCCFSHYRVSWPSSGSLSLLSSSCCNRACLRTWLSGTLKTWPRSICFLHCTVCTAVGNHTGSEISAFLKLSGCFMITVPRRHPHGKHFGFWGLPRLQLVQVYM